MPVRTPQPELDLARLAQEATERAARLAAREQAIERRERELAEQRRVMAEEYRLMHQLRFERSAEPRRGAGGASGPKMTTGTARFGPEPRGGFFAWLKRIFTGSRAAVQGH
jgi:hypothetical protein